MNTRFLLLLCALLAFGPPARAGTNTAFNLWPTNTPVNLLGADGNGYGVQIGLSTLAQLVSVGGVATNFYRLTTSPVSLLTTNTETLLYTLTFTYQQLTNILGFIPATNATFMALTNGTGYGTLTLKETSALDDTFLQALLGGGLIVNSGADPFTTPVVLSSTGVVASTFYGKAFTTNLSGNLTGTNFTARGTNTFPLGADIAFATKSLTSLVNGNNAAVPIGTNVFLEGSGPTTNFTICGLDGQPNRDGKLAFLINTNGYPMTIAHQSGVEGTEANRIWCPLAADVSTLSNGYAFFRYSGTLSRWLLVDIYPTAAIGSGSGASLLDATNAATSVIALNLVTGTLISGANATNAAYYAISNKVIPYAASAGNATGSVSTATAATHSTNFWGLLSVTNFNHGSGASSSSFWRGDGNWASTVTDSYHAYAADTASEVTNLVSGGLFTAGSNYFSGDMSILGDLYFSGGGIVNLGYAEGMGFIASSSGFIGNGISLTNISPGSLTGGVTGTKYLYTTNLTGSPITNTIVISNGVITSWSP